MFTWVYLWYIVNPVSLVAVASKKKKSIITRDLVAINTLVTHHNRLKRMNTSYFIFRYIFLVDLCQFRLATRFAYYIHPGYVTKQLLIFNILRPLLLKLPTWDCSYFWCQWLTNKKDHLLGQMNSLKYQDYQNSLNWKKLT